MTTPGPSLAPLVVAAGQAEAIPGEVGVNASTAAELIREAAGEGARVMVLPELFLPGYVLDGLAADRERDVVDPDGDPRLDPLRTACRETDTVAVVGASVRRGERRTIGILLVDPDGRVSHAYDKQHLLSAERKVFEPGADRAIATVDGWPLGLAVCYDGCFPEHARALSDGGALAYIAPAAYVVGSEHRRDLYYAARALDNGCYVILGDLTGRCGATSFSGGSAVYDPEGQPVVRAGTGREVVVATLDPARIEQVRTDHGMSVDRRADLGDLRRLAI